MSEYLSFNKSGQWELHKGSPLNDTLHQSEEKKTPPKSDYKPKSKEFQVHHGATLNGDLHADYGQKGSLHNSGHGVRPKQINWENAGVPSRSAASVYNERNPGVGD
jgi:hypothetical protein